jgi:hypothetical protein
VTYKTEDEPGRLIELGGSAVNALLADAERLQRELTNSLANNEGRSLQ